MRFGIASAALPNICLQPLAACGSALAILVLANLSGTPALAQSQDCAQIARALTEQTQLARRARSRAVHLRDRSFVAELYYQRITAREPTYTGANLAEGLEETRSDPDFNTASDRGVMLAIHMRVLEGVREAFDDGVFGMIRFTALAEQLRAEAVQADGEAIRHQASAASLEQAHAWCQSQAPNAVNSGFSLSAGPSSGTTPTAIADMPAGMTTFCQLTGGPRQGQTINLSQEHGFPLYIPIGDICYDPQSDTSIGLAIAP
jgi:hypothetical protein